jgi:uncharacterized membrane protein
VARLAGLGLIARALTNMEMKELLGISPGRGFRFQKTITINAPVERVFHFLSNYENLPKFVSHLRQIRRSGNNCSHWVAAGPAGTTVEWDARITDYVPNRLLAWKSLPGSTIRTEGTLKLERVPDFTTRVDLKLSYVPPAGALGQAIAALFGADPKSALDTDMNRLKTLLETGTGEPDGGAVIPGFTQAQQQHWQGAH